MSMEIEQAHRRTGVHEIVNAVKSEILPSLLAEIKRTGNRTGRQDVAETTFLELLVAEIKTMVIDELRQELSEELSRKENRRVTNNGSRREKRLEKAEQKLSKVVAGDFRDDSEDDEDETADSSSQYPNLKYRKPKYKNTESILKYVESSEDGNAGAGVKLVIMNFND